MKNSIAEIVKAHGFRVFTRPGRQSYVYYTDGKSIGYAQADVVCTVHKPNALTGTGFKVHDGPLTRAALEEGFALAPQWADAHSVCKYASIDEFLSHKDNAWGGGLVEV